MELDVSPELELMRSTLRRFVTEEVIPLERESGLTWDNASPKDLRRQVRLRSKELGLYGADMPRDAGGLGISFFDRCVLEMEAHYHDTVFFEDVLGGGGGPTTLLLAANESQRRRYLDPLMSGEVTTCFALSEADAGSDATALRTKAVRDGDGYVINGAKSIVSNGAQADFVMVFAVTDPAAGPGGISCFLIDAGAPGYRVAREHTCMAFTGYQAELVFDDCRVGADGLLGQEGHGLLMALDWINGNRVRTAAMATGIARRLLSMSAAYAQQRSQFGNPIATYQAIQFKLADMATELYAAESIVRRTAWMRDQGLDIRREAAMAKLYASEMVNRAAYEAIQIHGGAGCLLETNVERVYRMVRILTILEGTSEMQRLTIARSVLKRGV